MTAAFLALLIENLSATSKVGTERIWLPFAAWLLPTDAFLSCPRAWLIARALLALLVKHLLPTGW
ncbi:hypothetical protein M2160_008744 [Streptomyces sp. SAI-117]|nr:hypothetical protein [Streptomyces sp. SAI-117]